MDKQNKSKGNVHRVIPDRIRQEVRQEAKRRFDDSEFPLGVLKLDVRRALENIFIEGFEQGYSRGYHQGYEMGDKEGYARGLTDGSAKGGPV